MVTNGSTLNLKELSLEKIRVRCGYEKMDALWHTVRRIYPEAERPKRHDYKPSSFFMPLLEALATPNANKSEGVVSGAQSLLLEIRGIEIQDNLLTPFSEPLPEPKPKAEFDYAAARKTALNILLGVICVAHAGLVWYDCAVLWGVPGAIGGGIMFAIIAAALIVAYDETLSRSSNDALWVVWMFDAAAWYVHFKVFQTPSIDDIVTGFLCAFICLGAAVAFYLYRDIKIM